MKIAVLGAGNWGTTLALLLHGKGYEVTLWEFFPERAERIKRERENKEFLPGFPIPREVKITSSIEEALQEKDLVVFAVPSHALRNVASLSSPHLSPTSICVSVVKGIEENTFLRMSQVLEEEIPHVKSKVVVLSGPSIAREVAQQMPASVVAASISEENARKVQEVFFTPYFRVYRSKDIVGVELGGALKNVYAIAAGICDGLGFGANAKAALLTRALAELKRLGVAMGGRPETFSGLSGMGDLLVTAFSRYSRNRHVGEEVGKGRKLDEVLSEMVMVAEGVRTTKSVVRLAEKYQVEMPIAREVHAVLFEGKEPKEGVRNLMGRALKEED
ncbi:NAD(P)H-dependent glycerol-3-phosphate dehydrogenase [bacterium]|nr:MAG: NAD(P)H-dependent glycerol-3-phosphate dehydrogenase [bacterium]